ncbi:MAG: 50S ribosomal protein L9 [Cytophagia bacterium]|nr:50S ribosomal protein L9 [Cytophagia bacterium]
MEVILKTDVAGLGYKNDVVKVTLTIGTKAGETGRIFGAVTAIQVADALKAKGFDVDRRKVVLKESPKQLGTYSVTLDLHKEVKHEIKISVVAE